MNGHETQVVVRWWSRRNLLGRQRHLLALNMAARARVRIHLERKFNLPCPTIMQVCMVRMALALFTEVKAD